MSDGFEESGGEKGVGAAAGDCKLFLNSRDKRGLAGLGGAMKCPVVHQCCSAALAALVLMPVAARAVPAEQLTLDTRNFPTVGTVHRHDPRLDALLDPAAKIEVIAAGFDWCEGPVWVADPSLTPNGGYLLFSEIPSNTVRRWDEGSGLSVFLRASGFTGPGTYSGEPGSNGLAVDAQGRLVSCEHGDRRLSVLTPGGGKRTLADAFEGKRFNSPNDLTIARSGDIYFTDPPYGLPKQADDPFRETAFCGVYRWNAKTKQVSLVTDQMTRPNGIALSPDERTLYVAQSDGAATLWMTFPVAADGTTGAGRVFKDVTALGRELRGSCDGLKVDAQGNLWATGPGGVHIMAPDGTLLGRIETGQFTSNVAFGGKDGTTLFLTADMYVCRIQTMVTGKK
jgi:gluconolactonase